MSKIPPIHILRERIDDDHVAVLSYSFKVGRRNMWHGPEGREHYGPVPWLYGLSVFTIVSSEEARYDRWQNIGWQRLMDTLGTRSRLPSIGPCESVPGWSDYA